MCCIRTPAPISESYDVIKHELTLQCVVSGDRPKITWFKDNYHISNNRYAATEDYGGIRRLTIADPVPSDFGCFTCRSEDTAGHIDEISLRVSGRTLNSGDETRRSQRSRSKFHERSVVRLAGDGDVSRSESVATNSCAEHMRDARRAPVFSTRLTDRTAAEHSTIKLTCQVLGTDVHVEWWRGAERVDGDPRVACRCRDGLATLEVFSARPDDTGKYTCTATNQFGEDSCTGYLRVFAGHERRPMPPIFTRPVKGSV